MSKEIQLRFELLSYWQAGTGRGAAAVADSVVVTDEQGLPYLPGKSVKGLLRQAMTTAAEAGAIDPTRVVRWFGSEIPTDSADEDREQQLEASRYTTRPGELWFGSAMLPADWRRWSRHGARDEVRAVTDELVTYVASTAIDAQGVARNKTLRASQVAVPLTLYATVQGPASGEWVKDLEIAQPLLRCLGTRRHRGYGRVRVTVEGS